MDSSRFHQLAAEFSKQRILVIGDLMLDEFIWGKVSRVSPEAPVPVVDVTAESYYPGGAANVARNLREFTAHTAVMGLAGTDGAGGRLVELLAAAGIDAEAVIRDGEVSTTVKTRIIARSQQVVRVDRERRRAATTAQTARAIASLDRAIDHIDGIVVADYGKGFVTQALADRIYRTARGRGKTLAVDPHPHTSLVWTGATIIKPNRAEAFLAAGLAPSEPVEPVLEDRTLFEAARRLYERWRPEHLLITLGDQGMLLFSGGAAPFYAPAAAKDVFDVSGAGDTAIALLTLSLCAGATPIEAAELANRASGIVVGKVGTATVTPEELAGAV